MPFSTCRYLTSNLSTVQVNQVEVDGVGAVQESRVVVTFGEVLVGNWVDTAVGVPGCGLEKVGHLHALPQSVVYHHLGLFLRGLVHVHQVSKPERCKLYKLIKCHTPSGATPTFEKKVQNVYISSP